MKTIWIAATAALGLLAFAPATATAAARPLASGQTLSLPLNDETDGPALKVMISKAAIDGYMFEATSVPGESGDERRARNHQVVLDTPEGRDLVSFVHVMAEGFRTRYAAAPPSHDVTVSITLDEKLKIDGGDLMGDALKAGFTFGLGAPATVPLNFVTHMDVAVTGADGVQKTYACNAQVPGRPPRTPKKNDPHVRDEYTRMYDAGRRACLAQVVDQMDGKPAVPASSPATPAAAAKPSLP